MKNGHYDIGIHTICYFTSIFSSNPKLLIIVLGLIFGMFNSSVLYEAGKVYSRKNSISLILMLILVFVIFPTQAINQRFWIAAMIFVRGLQLIFLYDKRKGWVYIIVSPLMHIGMMLSILGLLIFYMVKSLNSHYLILFVPFSLYFGSDQLILIEQLAGSIGGSVEGKFSDYTGESATQLMEMNKNRIWYAAYQRELALLATSLLIIYVSIAYKKLEKYEVNLFKLNLVFINIACTLIDFSMSFRYFEMFIFIQVFTLFLFVQKNILKQGFKKLFWIVSPVTLLFLGMKFTSVLQFIKPTFFVTNVITALLVGDIKSVWHYIDFINS